MIKDILNILTEKDYNIHGLQKTISYYLNNMTDTQLYMLLKEGMNINSGEFILIYVEGMGFRCYNTDKYINGNKPVCNIIEKNLNERIKNYKL